MRTDPLVLEARSLAQNLFAPRAAESDRADAPPRANINALAAAGLLGITVPSNMGGRGADAATVRHVLEEIAAGCGVTAFCAFQHLVAGRHVASSDNERLRTRVLPDLVSGARIATVAFSHLRRSGPPCLRATPASGGAYLFDGAAPWATGIGLANDVLIAATQEDGTSVWAFLPLDAGPAIEASSPLSLLAMSASGTVSLRCNGLFIGSASVVKLVRPEELARDTAMAALFFSSLSLGAVSAAVRVLDQQGVRSGEPAVKAAALRFAAALRDARALVDAQALRPLAPEVVDAWFDTRAACIELGVRAGHAALAACGGAATALDHPAQRILREAALYTTTAQASALRAATLARLTADLPSG